MSTLTRFSFELQYDPDDVDIRLEHFTVEDLVHLIESNKLEITEENDLQRLGNLWDLRRKSLLIESLMIKLPLPIFYFDGSDKIWQVIDGLQRLTTLFQFISEKNNNNFHLQQLEYLGEQFSNYSFYDLPLSMRRRILDSPIEAYVINPGTPLAVKYNIFNRINTLGLRLKMQEVRNAIFRGIASNFTKELAKEPVFIRATNGKVNVMRMDDREYVTRFVSFQWFLTEYASDMDDFLRKGMLKMAETSEKERQDVRNVFISSMNRAYELLGNFCFYRIDLKGKIGRTPNKALFDTLSWNLSKLSDIEFQKLLSNKNNFRDNYIEFINEIHFAKTIGDTTSSKSNVKNRFYLLEYFFKNQL
jgi:hypothetical protein